MPHADKPRGFHIIARSYDPDTDSTVSKCALIDVTSWPAMFATLLDVAIKRGGRIAYKPYWPEQRTHWPVDETGRDMLATIEV